MAIHSAQEIVVFYFEGVSYDVGLEAQEVNASDVRFLSCRESECSDSRCPIRPMSRSGKNAGRMVRAFCKKHRICVSCLRRWTERDTTRCGKCNRARSKYQKSLLRRNYERDVKAGVCVRCHKLPATPTNKRCQKCQDRHADQKRLSK